jgi:hypothetical protein
MKTEGALGASPEPAEEENPHGRLRTEPFDSAQRPQVPYINCL